MEIEFHSNLILLFSFDRGYLSKSFDPETKTVIETVKRELIKCRIWFSDLEELADFLIKHRPIPSPNNSEDYKETKWMPYMTVTAEEMGVK